MIRDGDHTAAIAAAVVAITVAQGGAVSPAARLGVGVLLSVIIGICVARRPGGLVAEEWLALTFLGWAMVSAIVNRGHPLAAKEMLVDWLVAWWLFVFIRRMADRDRSAVVWIAGVAAAVVAVAIVVESFSAGAFRVGGMYVNPNVAVALMVPVIPLLFTLRETGRRGPLVMLAVIAAAGALVTGSRAGLIALVVAAAVLLPGGRLKLAAVVLMAAVAATLLIWRFSTMPDSLAWHRFAIWRAVWDLVLAHPMAGVGPGWLEEATGVVRIAHPEPIARYQHVIGSAESTALGVVARTGLVGIAIFLGALIVWLRRVFTDGRLHTKSAQGLVLAIGVLAAFHDYLDQGVVLWWWSVLLALMFPLPVVARDQRLPFGIRATIGTVAVGIVLWGIVQPAYARRLWWSRPSTPALAEQVMRAEPWLAEVAQWRVRNLLEQPTWSWEDAAEALALSGRAVRIHSRGAAAWSADALVNARIVQEFGAWSDVVTAARRGYRMATRLEPHLPWYWLRWGQLERSLDHLDDAEVLAQRSVTEEPNFVRGWLFLARVRFDKGLLEEARDARDRGLAAHQLAQGRRLSEYESNLMRLPWWQVEELARVLD